MMCASFGCTAVREHRLQPLDADPVGLEVDHPDVRAAVLEVQQRAVVRRRLDDHRVALLDEQLEQERVRLHRAVGHQHLLDGHAVLLGDPLAQRHVADARAVRRRPGGVVLEGELRGLAQALHVDDVERRRPAGEGDRGHGRQTSGPWTTSPVRSRPSPAGASPPRRIRRWSPTRRASRPRGREFTERMARQLSVPSPALRGADAQAAAPGGDRRLHGGDARQREQPRARRRAGDERDGGRGRCAAWRACSASRTDALGHLTSSGTIANLEALWVARELHPGKAIVHGANAHYTHSRMCARARAAGVRGAGGHRRPDRPGRGRGAVPRPATSARSSSPRARPARAPSTTSRGRWRCASATACGSTSTRPTAGSSRCSAEQSPPLVPAAPFLAIAQADSVVVDPHKHGLQPYGCGAVLFRDPSVGRLYKHDSPYTYFTSRRPAPGRDQPRVLARGRRRGGAVADAAGARPRADPRRRRARRAARGRG